METAWGSVGTAKRSHQFNSQVPNPIRIKGGLTIMTPLFSPILVRLDGRKGRLMSSIIIPDISHWVLNTLFSSRLNPSTLCLAGISLKLWIIEPRFWNNCWTLTVLLSNSHWQDALVPLIARFWQHLIWTLSFGTICFSVIFRRGILSWISSSSWSNN